MLTRDAILSVVLLSPGEGATPPPPQLESHLHSPEVQVSLVLAKELYGFACVLVRGQHELPG